MELRESMYKEISEEFYKIQTEAWHPFLPKGMPVGKMKKILLENW